MPNGAHGQLVYANMPGAWLRYFNEVGGIRFPHAAGRAQAIDAKRGRIAPWLDRLAIISLVRVAARAFFPCLRSWCFAG